VSVATTRLSGKAFVAAASASAFVGEIVARTSVTASAATGRAAGSAGLYLAKRGTFAVIREYNRRHPREPRFPRRDSATLFCRLKTKSYPVSWDEEVDEAAAAQLADDMRRVQLPNFFRDRSPPRVNFALHLEGKNPYEEYFRDALSRGSNTTAKSSAPPSDSPAAPPSAPPAISSDRKANPPAASTTRWSPYSKLRVGLASRFAQKNRKISSHSARIVRKKITQDKSPAVSEDFSGLMSIIEEPTSPSSPSRSEAQNLLQHDVAQTPRIASIQNINDDQPEPDVAQIPRVEPSSPDVESIQNIPDDHVTPQPGVAQTPRVEQSSQHVEPIRNIPDVHVTAELDVAKTPRIEQSSPHVESIQIIPDDQATPKPAIAQSRPQTPFTDISSTCDVTPPRSAASDISSTCDVTPIPAPALGTTDIAADIQDSRSPSPKASPMPGAWTEDGEISAEATEQITNDATDGVRELGQKLHHMQLRSRKTELPRIIDNVENEGTAPPPALASPEISNPKSQIKTPKARRYGSDKVTVADRVQQKLEAAKRANEKYRITEISQAWKNRVREAVRNGASGLQAQDFARCVPPTASSSRGTDLWLNDEVVNAYLKIVSEHGKRQDDKFAKVPSHHAFNSYFYKNIADSSKGPSFVARWSKRAGIHGSRVLETEYIFIPINANSHWTLCVLSGRQKTITAYDSLNGNGRYKMNIILNWVKFELGDEFKEDEWTLINGQTSQQANSDDCGVFTITNARQLMLGADPKNTFNASKVRVQRERIVAEVLNGALIEG
jgi:hypothetical protein